MPRIRELAGLAIEQHNSPNRGGRMSGHRGVVLHIAQGTYRGTISWQLNPDQRYADGTRVNTCSTWIVGKERGEWAQMVDSDEIAWAHRGGSRTWLSIELEGFAPDAPTDWQVEACAQLLAWSARTFGHPIARADHEGERGLGHHSMDREQFGVEWGHEACPGAGVIAAKNAIVARARQIAAGEEDDMLRDERIKMRPWVAEKWGFEDARADQHLSATYGFARLGYEAAVAAEAKLAALLAQQAGRDVAATVQELLDRAAVRERAERQAELGEVTEALGRAAEERAAIAELVASVGSGERDARAVVDEIARRLAPTAPAPARDQG